MNNIKIPWYLNTWTIAVCLSFSFLIIPIPIGIYLILKQRQYLKKYDAALEDPDFLQMKKQAQEEYKSEKEQLKSQLNEEMKDSLLQIEDLKNNIKELNEEYIDIFNKVEPQKHGFFETEYKFENSVTYKKELDEIRAKQKELVKTKEAMHYTDDWVVNGSEVEGRKMREQNMKLAMRMFNVECDLIISKVTFRNFESSKKRIISSHKVINNMNKLQELAITDEYLNLKLLELELAYEYELKLQEEKEQLKIHKEQLREEQKVLKEIEAEKKKIEKEETHFNNAIKDVQNMISTADPSEISALELKLAELEEQLNKINEEKENVLNRATNTRAGYVYVISNIGSFGENIYKIGVTRRLDPYERIRELSSASVPFPFDVHAMIFSDDAPTLENTLHKHFYEHRVNKVNDRKEFFNIDLSSIKNVVAENYNDIAEFIEEPDAEQYKSSLNYAIV